MGIRAIITSGLEHAARFTRSLSGWKYANWIIAFLFALTALMATLNNFGWALFFLIASAIAAAISSWRSIAVRKRFKVGKGFQSRPVLGLRITALMSIAVLWGIPAYYLAKKINTSKPESQPTIKPIALFIECHPAGLPIKLVPHSTIHVRFLNPKLEPEWFVYDVINDADLARLWPAKNETTVRSEFKTAEETRVMARAGMTAIKCEVDNESAVLLENVFIKFSHVNFIPLEKSNTVKYKKDHAVVINPLGTSPFNFYIVNQCDLTAMIFLPDSAIIQVLGETQRRAVSLQGPNRSPQMPMILFPGLRWNGFPDCR